MPVTLDLHKKRWLSLQCMVCGRWENQLSWLTGLLVLLNWGGGGEGQTDNTKKYAVPAKVHGLKPRG
jgi:hypothetical protein